MKLRIPKRITPCPITEAIVEVRFSTDIDSSAVFGIIYNQIKKEFPTVQKLPVNSLPETIRLFDPNIKYTPHFRLELNNDPNTLIQIGPQVFSVVVKEPYPGWPTFLEKILLGLDRLNAAGVVRQVERFGLRYLNFFDFDVISKSEIDVRLGGSKIESDRIELRTEIVDGPFINIIRANNNTTLRRQSEKKDGSIVDIDTVIDNVIPDFFEKKESIINSAHEVEKKWFFSIMGQKYLDQLTEVTF